ncbi:hypothetical protein BASA81_008494 [Batrachochytrium salamandrivorans]|nr:hypothetical protein BASA81_008494 [Batrachochytrium salamandrivorans]
MLSKRRPTHQQLVERRPNFLKLVLLHWLALNAETSGPCTQCTESGALLGSPTHLCKRFSLRKAWRPSKGNAGCPHPYKRIKSFKAWIPRSEAADKDKLAAILSFAAKTVTTIQRSPDVKARNFFRSLLASIGGKTLEAATAEATKIRVQTPGF